MSASFVEVVVEGGEKRSEVGIFGFDMIDTPLEDDAADFLEQAVQVAFVVVGGGRRDGPGPINANELSQRTDARDEFAGQRQQRGSKRGSQQQPGNGTKRHETSLPGLSGLATFVLGR